MLLFPFAVIFFVLGLYSPLQAAERYEIRTSYETKSESPGGSGSSRGQELYLETIRPIGDDCTEKTYDSLDAPGQTRPLAQWKLPVKVHQCGTDAPTLANEDEMVARLEEFLAAINVTREACGQYYFTWNVFQIDCDPAVALEWIISLDLSSQELRESAQFSLPDNAGSATLSQMGSSGDEGAIWRGEGTLEPDEMRHDAAYTIKVVEELNGTEISLDEAIARLDGYEFSGEFSVEFVVDPESDSISRTVISESRKVDASGGVETNWAKRITVRKRAEPAIGPDPSN